MLRDRPFMGLIALNVVFVSAGYTQLELLPVFAKNEAGVSEQAIGLIFLASSVALVVCQLPSQRSWRGGPGCGRSRRCPRCGHWRG